MIPFSLKSLLEEAIYYLDSFLKNQFSLWYFVTVILVSKTIWKYMSLNLPVTNVNSTVNKYFLLFTSWIWRVKNNKLRIWRITSSRFGFNFYHTIWILALDDGVYNGGVFLSSTIVHCCCYFICLMNKLSFVKQKYHYYNS